MQLEAKPKAYTPEEYLKLEAQAEYKSEYRDGEIILMTGENTNHNEIAGNIAANLKFALRKRNYRVYIGDVRLWIPEFRLYTYPDVMVIEGEPVYTEIGTTTVMNPTLIVEVLSKSTKNYDQGDKFRAYRSLREFREYVLVDQEKSYVMYYGKTESGQWLLTEYETDEAEVSLNTVNLAISISNIYDGVDFSDAG
jgi:Uma2 family endonuclease